MEHPKASRTLAVVALVLAFGAGAAGAQSGDAEPEPPRPGPGLDRLLRLPQAYEADGERRGGATAAEWRGRFAEARGSVEKARKSLARTEKQLEGLAGESTTWQMAVPGGQSGSGENSPLSFRLRQEVKRQRAEIEEGERALRQLEIEADLADVPQEWRREL